MADQITIKIVNPLDSDVSFYIEPGGNQHLIIPPYQHIYVVLEPESGGGSIELNVGSRTMTMDGWKNIKMKVLHADGKTVWWP